MLRSGGVWRIKGNERADFKDEDKNHVLELSWHSPRRGMNFLYKLSIDGESILNSSVRPRNWPLLFIPYATPLILWIAFGFLRAGIRWLEAVGN
jgi:hypothetical protein